MKRYGAAVMFYVIRTKRNNFGVNEMQNCENGRSMIEMLGVLAIIGVLSVGGLAGYNKAMHQYKINSTMEQIAMISSKLSSYGSSADSYAGLNNKSAYKIRAIPAAALEDEDTCKGSGTDCPLSNPFGGTVTIEASNIEDGQTDEQAYAIIYKGLSEEACISIGSSTWFQSKGDSLLGIAVGKKGSADSVKASIAQDSCASSGSDYAVGCLGGELPLDPITTSSVCICPANDCEFIVKFF